VQNAESADAFYPLYLCHPDKDCVASAVEDELVLKPDDPDILQGAAQFFYSRSNPGRALVLLRHRSELQPQDASAKRDLAVALLFTGDFPGAQQQFGEARKLAPDDLSIQMDTGWACFIQGNFEQAVKAFDGYLKSGLNTSADPILGEYYSLLRLGRRTEAEKMLSRQADGFHGNTLDHALLLDAQQRISDAVVAAGDDYDHARFSFLDGLKWVQLNRPDTAASNFRDALKKAEPGSIWALAAQTELKRLQPQAKPGP